jgi:hypothetical protein
MTVRVAGSCDWQATYHSLFSKYLFDSSIMQREQRVKGGGEIERRKKVDCHK